MKNNIEYTSSHAVSLALLTCLSSYLQILTVVLKKAFPDMMRFLVTTLMLYFGFMFCGWVVLGPYHIKVSNVKENCQIKFFLLCYKKSLSQIVKEFKGFQGFKIK